MEALFSFLGVEKENQVMLTKAELEVIARLCLPLIDYEDWLTTWMVAKSCRLFYQIMEKRIMILWLNKHAGRLQEKKTTLEILQRKYVRLSRVNFFPEAGVVVSCDYRAFRDNCLENMRGTKSEILDYANQTWLKMDQEERKIWAEAEADNEVIDYFARSDAIKNRKLRVCLEEIAVAEERYWSLRREVDRRTMFICR